MTDDGVETGTEETDTGVTPQGFAAYVAVNNDLPVLANLTDADICADVWGPAADADESDAEKDTAGQTDVNDCPTNTTSDALQSLRTIHAYLEAGGCDDYGLLYVPTDQLHTLNRKNSTQKTIKDYFL